MNNETLYEIRVKKRGDGVYDIYVNGQLQESKGNLDAVTKFFEKLKSYDTEKSLKN